MSTDSNLRDLNHIWIGYLLAFGDASKYSSPIYGEKLQRLLLRWEVSPAWRQLEKQLQHRLDPRIREYVRKYIREDPDHYKFYYDHWVSDGKIGYAGKITTTFREDGSLKRTYITVHVSDRSLYDFLFSDLHPAIIGAYIGRDMVHELRHLYQKSYHTGRSAYKIHNRISSLPYLQQHTEIDAFAVGAAFGLLTHGTGHIGSDKKNIAFYINNLLSSTDGHTHLCQFVHEINVYFPKRDRLPREWQRFMRKTYKYFNELLDIHFDE